MPSLTVTYVSGLSVTDVSGPYLHRWFCLANPAKVFNLSPLWRLSDLSEPG